MLREMGDLTTEPVYATDDSAVTIAVPEPESLAFVGLGLLSLLIQRSRFTKR